MRIALTPLLVLLATGCGSKRSTKSKDAGTTPVVRDPGAECTQIFDRFHAQLAPHLKELGLHEAAIEARSRDKLGLAACSKLDETQRSCLLGAPVAPTAWATCKVAAPFTLFDATPAREALLGEPVTPADSQQRVAALAGRWHKEMGLDDAITWQIAADGKLASRRTSKQRKLDEPPKQLAFEKLRLLAIKTGTSAQFVPFFSDGERLYLSWTSGALAIPIASEQQFALDLADGRWLLWNAPACRVLDPKLGVTDITCAFEAGKPRTFVIREDGREQRWPLHNDVLIHPAMEVFVRQR